MDGAAGVGDKAGFGVALGASIYFEIYLAHIELGDDERLDFFRKLADFLFGEGPNYYEAQFADLDALFPRHLDRRGRNARGYSIRDNDNVRALRILFLELDYLIGVEANLIDEPADELLLVLDCYRRIAPFVVRDSGYMEPVTVSRLDRLRHEVAIKRQIWSILFWRQCRIFALDYINLIRGRNHDLLEHMPHAFISHK